MDNVRVIHVTEYPDYENTNHVLVDVREVYEFEDGHLPGAVNIPLSQFAARFSEIPDDRTVVLVCRVGGRSMQAASFLAMQDGYANVEIINLDGGTEGWLAAGNPVD